MRKILFLIILMFIFSVNSSSQILKLEREIDLSFFLRPYEPHRIMAGVDSYGDIFITQERKEEFLKLSQSGKVIFRAPSRVEGEILDFDVDGSGNPVCMFSPRMFKETGTAIFSLVWFDGKNGNKIKELNLADLFELITFVRILRPENLILVNGIGKNENMKKYSLHIIDFDGRHIKSFSPVKDPSDIRGEQNKEYFQRYLFFIDWKNKKIFQGLPFADEIKVIVFDYSGNQVGEMSLNHFSPWRILPHKNGIWIYNGKGEYEFFQSSTGKFLSTGIKMLRIPALSFITSDQYGNLYFADGDKKSQILSIYTIKE